MLAADQSSTSFQNKSSGFVPAVFNQSSPNFQVSGSLEDSVGFGSSASWNIRSGVPLTDTTTPPASVSLSVPASSGGGGGGPSLSSSDVGGATGYAATPTAPASSRGVVKPPTLFYRSPTFSSHQSIRGTYDTSTPMIFVNGSAADVSLHSRFEWQRDLPLFLGQNIIAVRSQNSAGDQSITIGGVIERMLIGDVNNDHKVDDVDISLFTRAWKQYTPAADFNEDGTIDEVDLSLLVSHWERFW